MAKEISRGEKNMFENNVSLHKLMYMTIYDTLEKMFENISRKKKSWNNLYLRESEKSLSV